MDLIRPFINEPALVLDISSTRKYVVIADLHLGIEYTLIKIGIQIPSQTQTQRLIDRLMNILNKVRPTALIILGDIKHNVPGISPIEWQVVPTFFEKFTEIPIHIILGNHESGPQIKGLTPRNTTIHHAQGCLLELKENNNPIKIALFHGHTWPSKELFKADVIIMAHNHPVIEFKNKFNVRTYESAWIRTHWNKLKVAKAYLKYLKVKNAKNPLELLQKKYKTEIAPNPEIIIMPAFNDLLGGIPFNTKDSKFIGPLLKSNLLNIDEAEVLLLDGTLLGKIKEIRRKN
ncbi:MAG: metallophosphoesterase [Promethearchaeota archaeon]